MIFKTTLELDDETARMIDAERVRIEAATGLGKVTTAATIRAVLRRALPPVPVKAPKNG